MTRTVIRQTYQLQQSTYPLSGPLSSSANNNSNSNSHIYAQSYDESSPRSGISSSHFEGYGNISSNLPEYSYPMTPSQRMHRSIQLQQYRHHPEDEHQRQHQPERSYHVKHVQMQGSLGQNPHLGRKSVQHQRSEASQGQPEPMMQQRPPPIRTQWSDDSSRTCPPLSYHSGGSGCTTGFRSADSRNSPATPRSVQMHGSLLRQPIADPYAFTESPLDYRPPNSFHHAIVGGVRGKFDSEEQDMEHCSERDDVHERTAYAEDEDQDNDYVALENQLKRRRTSNPGTRALSHGKTPQSCKNTLKSSGGQIGTEDEEVEGVEGSLLTSTSSKPSSTSSKASRASALSSKRSPRRSPLMTNIGDATGQVEDDATVGAVQPLAGRGLRVFAQCLVHELCGGEPGVDADDIPVEKGQENIRRRVYDALNVLKALGIISFDNKDIHWVGIEQSTVVDEVTQCQAEAAASLHSSGLPEGGGDDESEEPEDDDMEIEKLQREVDAMKLLNELEQAKLQDQLTRHVQVLNLVKRNKRREAKEEERAERRRQRKEKCVQTTAADEDPSMTDVGPQGVSDHGGSRLKSDRHRRRRSSRHTAERPVDKEGPNVMGHMDKDAEEEDLDDSEDAYQRRKQERRARRERKEKREQRRQEKEQLKLQLPLVVVRMPGYTAQSSDSESSISVVRRVREEQRFKKSGKSKRHCESSGQETTTVEIQIPQQDELSIISDTEILGDLGFNTVTMDDLETMLPSHLMNAVKYTINAEERQRSPRSQRRSKVDEVLPTLVDSEMVTMSVPADHMAGPTCITVRGGFEREIVRAASEDASSTA
ncbi:hypothetical protein EDD11_007499 [Mortierella claussenii]|nr:hypothetical protein EDD11_007499 [Mortierella claussenii]